MIGDSLAMRQVLQTVSRVGPQDITVLVRGETGTGKELVASLLHTKSRRASAPLVTFNCAAIADELADAELFGHARGAFTGAHAAREGFFSLADGGTLVLDEVGELSLPVQAKLLRALQKGEIQQVGSARVEQVDVRMIASTNRDLKAEVRAGRFREDLYYRLAVVEVIVPPLRDHRDDIPAMVAEFAARYGERFGKPGIRVTPALVEALLHSEWPGNVRHLENTIARLVALCAGDELGVEAFGVARACESLESSPKPALETVVSLRDQMAAVEKRIILQALTSVRWNRTQAARRLGMSRTSFIDRLRKYGLLSRPVEAEV